MIISLAMDHFQASTRFLAQPRSAGGPASSFRLMYRSSTPSSMERPPLRRGHALNGTQIIEVPVRPNGASRRSLQCPFICPSQLALIVVTSVIWLTASLPRIMQQRPGSG